VGLVIASVASSSSIEAELIKSPNCCQDP